MGIVGVILEVCLLCKWRIIMEGVREEIRD